MPDALIFSRSDELAAGRPYAERVESNPGLHDLAAEYLLANLVRPLRSLVWDSARSLRPILDHVGAAEAAMKSESDAGLARRAMAMRGRLPMRDAIAAVPPICSAPWGHISPRRLHDAPAAHRAPGSPGRRGDESRSAWNLSTTRRPGRATKPSTPELQWLSRQGQGETHERAPRRRDARLVRGNGCAR